MSRHTDPALHGQREYQAAQQAHDARQPADDEVATTPVQRAQFEAHLERLIAAAGATAFDSTLGGVCHG